MLGIVLPTIALACLATIDVSVNVSVEVVLVIDGYVAVAPIAIAPITASPGTQRKSRRAPRQPHAGIVPWIGIRVIGVGRRRRSVDDRRVV